MDTTHITGFLQSQEMVRAVKLLGVFPNEIAAALEYAGSNTQNGNMELVRMSLQKHALSEMAEIFIRDVDMYAKDKELRLQLVQLLIQALFLPKENLESLGAERIAFLHGKRRSGCNLPIGSVELLLEERRIFFKQQNGYGIQSSESEL